MSLVAGQIVIEAAQLSLAEAPDGRRAMVVSTAEGLSVVVPMDDQVMLEFGKQMSAPRVVVASPADVAHLNGRG